MDGTQRSHVTLAVLLGLLQDEDHAFIIRRRGPHECEAVAAGTAKDLRSANMGIWRDKIVDRLWLDVWPDKNTPVLAILTGEKET